MTPEFFLGKEKMDGTDGTLSLSRATKSTGHPQSCQLFKWHICKNYSKASLTPDTLLPFIGKFSYALMILYCHIPENTVLMNIHIYNIYNVTDSQLDVCLVQYTIPKCHMNALKISSAQSSDSCPHMFSHDGWGGQDYQALLSRLDVLRVAPYNALKNYVSKL